MAGEKVGSIFYEASIDAKGVQSGAGVINKELAGLDKGFGGLGKSILAVGGIIGGIVSAQALVGFFRNSIEAANESNRVMAQTQAVITSTGMAAGLTGQQISEMAAQIQNTTPISDEAAQTGMNMLLTFTNIGSEVFPQATQAMVDMATAMNGGVTPGAEELRGTAIQLGKALQDPILGVTALRRVGVNFTSAQQDMLEQLVKTGRGMEAQKFILAELATEFGGSAAAQLDTFAGRMQQLHNQLNNIQEQVGNALTPALLYMTSAFGNAAEGANPLIIATKVLASGLIGLAYVARQVGAVIATVFSALWLGIQGDFSSAKEAINMGLEDMTEAHISAQQALTNVWQKETDKQTGIANKGFNQQMDGSGKKSAKLKIDLEDETRKFEQEQEKRKKAFEQNLAELIFDHQDKVKSIKKDMEDENKSFSDSMAERVLEFKEKLAEMEEAHDEKVATITRDILEEKQATEQKNNEARLDTEESLEKEKEAYDEKVTAIEKAIAKEELQGKNKRQTVITNLKEQLEEEKKLYEEKVNTINAKLDKELQKNTEVSAKKLADLQLELDNENLQYEAQVAKATERDIKETLRLQAVHAQKIADYQASLKIEEDILHAHQADVDAVKDKARVDDITRLKNSFAEQNAEALANHNQRMIDLKEQATAEGEGQAGGFATGLLNKKPDVEGAGKQIADGALEQLKAGAGGGGGKSWAEEGKSWIRSLVDGLINALKSAWSTISNIGKSIWENLSAKGGSIQVPHFASGVKNYQGGLAVVGEHGPELVNLPQGADVIPNHVAFGTGSGDNKGMGGNQYITINIDKIGDQQDITAIGRELAFRSNIAV